jgi:cyclopropane-fatty-acyl-phospholipid synthase
MEDTLSSVVARVSSAASSLYNSFLGQTRSQARLNAIASYDQSNELFKVNTSQATYDITSLMRFLGDRLF